MKNLILNLLFVAFVTSFVKADVPRTPKYQDYAVLLNNSPFGKKKPPVVEVAPVVETKTTLGLLGVSRVADGWVVTLRDAKKPTERFMVETGKEPVNGISVVQVDQDQGDYRNTTAVISEGGRTYKVTFDVPTIEKNIAQSVKATKASKPNNNKEKKRGDENSDYQNTRQEMMREADALRKMRDAGNTGEEYQKRRKELREKSAELRSQWRQRRGRGNNSGNNSGGN